MASTTLRAGWCGVKLGSWVRLLPVARWAIRMTTALATHGDRPAMITSLVSSTRPDLVSSAGTTGATGAAGGRAAQNSQSGGAAGQSAGGLQPSGGTQPGGQSGQPGAGRQISPCVLTRT